MTSFGLVILLDLLLASLELNACCLTLLRKQGRNIYDDDAWRWKIHYHHQENVILIADSTCLVIQVGASQLI
jgi:hypothetical protein